MEQDELSEFLITRQGKKLPTAKVETHKEPEESFTREPLTTKNAVKFLLEGTLKNKTCRYCLNVTSPLYELDRIFEISGQFALYKVTVRTMIASFHPFKVADDPNFPDKICDKCLNRTLTSYLFTQQCEQSERALRNCFDDMYEKLEKLDPLEHTKKRGRQKLHPNYNVLYSEHKKVIDYAEPIINIVNIGSELFEANDANNKFECPRCWQVLPDVISLLNHEKIHPNSMWYNCRLCGKSFAKHNLLKRHIRSEHNSSDNRMVMNKGFKCADCGVGNESYDKHLQHIEKHKFQTVMQHLLDRNMDKLCSVCFNKDTNLVELDRNIGMCGGCPELTGQRTVYNILSATLPEKKSYKYQELYIPNEANIIRLVKKIKVDSIMKYQEKKSENVNYYFSDPKIISVLSVESDKSVYMFSKPQICENSLAITDSNTNAQIAVKKQNSVVSLCINTTEKDACKTQKLNDKEKVEVIHTDFCYKSQKEIIFIFSEPYYMNDNDNIFSIKTNGSISQSCNICWIFKNTKCIRCSKFNEVKSKNVKDICLSTFAPFTNISGDITSVIEDKKTIKPTETTEESCNLCWIFKSAVKCDYCKKINNNLAISDNNAIVNKTEIIKHDLIENDNPIKRKNTDILKNVDIKKSKWQCNICLTENTNRQACLCCDSQNYDCKKDIKVNLGINKNFYNTPNYKADLLKHNTSDLDLGNNKTNGNDITSISDGNIISSVFKEETLNDSMETEQIDIQEKLTSAPNNNFECLDNIFEQEGMDIVTEELNNPIVFPISNIIPVLSVTPCTFSQTALPFQFQIGVGSSNEKKTRRFLKPLRRMANLSNK